MDENSARFYEAAAMLCERVRQRLCTVPPGMAEASQEIRMRVGQPLALYTAKGHRFFALDGSLYEHPPPGAFVIARSDLFESFRSLCGYSLHTHQYELASGFISLAGGHRAGVCGTLTGSAEQQSGLREVSSINLRVARQIKGVARALLRELFSGGECGILVAGPPSGGKTTMIRDMARSLSCGECGEYYKVAVVDERNEIAAMHAGLPQNDMGPCTEILCGYPKGRGIELAIRTLSPHFIVCDEIGREDELSAVRQGLFSAVNIISTVHCENECDLMRRPQAKNLIESGAFKKIVLLHGSAAPATVRRIIDADELIKGGFTE